MCNTLKQKHSRFLRLINAIHDVASNVILGLRQPTEYFVKGVVSSELFTNNNYPDFRTEELETFLNERFLDGNEDIKLIESVTNPNELAKHPKTSMNLKSKLKIQNGHSSQHDSFTKLDEGDETDNTDDVSIQSHDNISTNTYPIAQELSENEQVSYLKTVYLIKRYFKVVIKTLQDSIPKTILRLLVYSANDKLHDDLVRDLYPHRVDELMADSPEMIAYKEDVMNMTEVMKEAISKIQKMRETPSNEIIPKVVKSL